MIDNSTDKNKPKVQIENIPSEMKKARRWVAWKWEDREGKPTKVPIDAITLYGAKSDDPSTWHDFGVALAAAEKIGNIAGIGFMLGDGWAGVDIDKCVSGNSIHFDGDIIVREFASYSEISPSGTGVKIIVHGSIERGRKHGGKEVYSDCRYFTITGRQIPNTPNEVKDRQKQLDAFIQTHFPDRGAKTKAVLSERKISSPKLEDKQILAIAFGAKNGPITKAIYDADHGALLAKGFYKAGNEPDWSRGVYSVLRRLAFFTQDFDQLDRLFRASGLYAMWGSKKWDRLCESEIQGAIDDQTDVYTAPEIIPDADPVCAEAVIPQQDEFLRAVGEAATRAAAKADFVAEHGYKFRMVSAGDFDKMVFSLEWLVKGVLVYGQPSIMGGPKKSMKTNLLCDLFASIGAGVPFLGNFPTTKKRACLISGESGEATIQETCRRICKAKQITMSDINGGLDFRLPKLSTEDELKELGRGLLGEGVEVVIIDPLYLCLLSGASDKNAGNIYDMGPILSDVCRTCIEAGAMPILAHHSRKNLNNAFEPLDLEDLAFSGVQEFARQWLLVNRRQSYEPGSGQHHIWLSSGGSVGHGGLWALNIDEGQLKDNFTGRIWDVKVLSREEAREEANLAKAEKKNAKEDVLDLEYMTALDHSKEVTRTELKKRLGWREDKFARVHGRVLRNGRVVTKTGTAAMGNGAAKDVEIIVRGT